MVPSQLRQATPPRNANGQNAKGEPLMNKLAAKQSFRARVIYRQDDQREEELLIWLLKLAVKEYAR